MLNSNNTYDMCGYRIRHRRHAVNSAICRPNYFLRFELLPTYVFVSRRLIFLKANYVIKK